MSTVFITGANKGIGLEFCRQYKSKGYDVIATCRTLSPELKSLDVKIITDIDVADESSMQTIVNELNNSRIDIAINNAGIMLEDKLEAFDLEGIRKQFEINALAPLLITHTILPRLANPSKLILITSRMGSIQDNTSGSYYGYRMSKTALNMAGTSLSHDLKDKGVAVGILHPGFVKTDLTGNTGHITAEESVAMMIDRINELNIENSGTFWHADGQVLPW